LPVHSLPVGSMLHGMISDIFTLQYIIYIGWIGLYDIIKSSVWFRRWVGPL